VETPKTPLIVFVQGSAWTFPDLSYEMGQMAWYAQNGIAVAMVTHRNCLNGNPFPAYLQDVKTAIRFLRSHAEEHHIDKDRIGIFGTSSGGNTALLVGLTGDDAAYRTAEYSEESDSVRLVVECFGPADLMRMLGGEIPEEPHADIFRALTAGKDVKQVMREMSPVNHVKEGKAYPPFLLIHGSADTVVPYDQMVLMYRKLCDQGADVRAICVDHAPHEGNFWSRDLHEIILAYIREKL
jgi:acetyl esterase/lipase